MINKQNWEETKQNYQAFWNHEDIGRPLLQVKALKGIQLNMYGEEWPYLNEDYKSLEDFYLNPQTILDRNLKYMTNTVYLAEALPIAQINLGPGIFAAYFGSEVILQESTISLTKVINDWEKDLKNFDPQNSWWLRTKEIVQFLLEKADGKYIVGLPSLNSVGTALSFLRGPAELAMDLIEMPEQVKKAGNKLITDWFNCLNEINGLMAEYQQGISNWMGLWCQKSFFDVQCDFSALISPAMFEEFFLPEIKKQCKELPYTIYHLDGEECLRHLDLILEIDELNAIQWQPGAGKPPAVEWIEILRRIQDKGKSVYVYASPKEALELTERLSSRGLYICINEYFSTEAEAKAFIKEILKRAKN